MIQQLCLFFQGYPSLLLIVSGALCAFAFAPYYLQFFAVIGFSVLFHHLTTLDKARTAFWRGWLFGAGFNIANLYWIGNSFITVDLWYLAPLGMVLFPCFMAFFPAIVTFLTIKMASSNLGRLFAFCLLWSLSDWLKGWILTGFPWTLMGYIWNLNELQITAYIGIYGLSALTIFIVSVVGSRSYRLISVGIVMFGCLWAGGHYRLSQYKAEETGVNLRIVQASISQKEKWQTIHFKDNLNKWIALSTLPAERPLKAIIWSESSVPAFIADYPEIRASLIAAIPPSGYLILGSPRKVINADKNVQYRTSTLALNDAGDILAIYDKSHLVPFGEYIPFKNILRFSKLTAGAENYSPGDGVKNMQLQGVPLFAPLICYEAIFSGQVIHTDTKPEWMMNQTNDAWYGESSGPHQHLNIVRVRAIEEGIPLIRSANNGISAVINPMGQILHRLELNEIGFIDFDLPKSLTTPTFFSRYHNLGFWLIMLVYGLLTLLFRNNKRLNKK